MHRLAKWIQKQDPYTHCLQETYFKPRDPYRLKVRGWKKIFHENGNQKKIGVAVLISEKNRLYFFFNFILFNFTILYWFCHISKSICHRYTCVPHPEPSSLLHPHTMPLGHPSSSAPSIQYHE